MFEGIFKICLKLHIQRCFITKDLTFALVFINVGKESKASLYTVVF